MAVMFGAVARGVLIFSEKSSTRDTNSDVKSLPKKP
jgi:hypothetical protein